MFQLTIVFSTFIEKAGQGGSQLRLFDLLRNGLLSI